MTLDQYLYSINNQLDKSTRSTVDRAPILAIPYMNLKTPELYRAFRDHPVYSVDQAKFIANRWGIEKETVNDTAIRSAIYYLTDYLMMRGAAMFSIIDEAIKKGIELSENTLKKIARRYGIDLLPVYYWIDFIRSLRAPYTEILQQPQLAQQQTQALQRQQQTQTTRAYGQIPPGLTT